MATVTYRKDRDTWQVRWRELKVTVDEDGNEIRRWVYRKRTAPTKPAAEKLARDVEVQAAIGERWIDARENAVATVGVVVTAYIKASAPSRPTATTQFRASLLQRWMDWAGHDRTIDTLTTGLLTDYADHLRGSAVKSVSRYVAMVEQWWRWAHNRADTYPGVPQPRRITGADGDIPHRVAPVATDNPTWAEVDRMLHALTPAGAPKGQGKGYGYRPQWALHRRVALTQRFQGLRISQIVGLRWADIDLEQRRLTLRAGRAGAKGQRRDRVVPLHPLLALEMATWERVADAVFARLATKGKRKGEYVTPRGTEVAEVFTAAWERSGVPTSKWGKSPGRPKFRTQFPSRTSSAT